jgi:hypothetical protein
MRTTPTLLHEEFRNWLPPVSTISPKIGRSARPLSSAIASCLAAGDRLSWRKTRHGRGHAAVVTETHRGVAYSTRSVTAIPS